MHFTDYDTRLAAYALIVDEHAQILLSWYNGTGLGEPGWTLPGGGVEFAESLEAAAVREVREETGYTVDLDRPLTTDSFSVDLGSVENESLFGRARPYKSVRVIYLARISGGSLGTLERGGTTDYAAWVPLEQALQDGSRTEIVDVAVEAWRRGGDRGGPARSASHG